MTYQVGRGVLEPGMEPQFAGGCNWAYGWNKKWGPTLPCITIVTILLRGIRNSLSRLSNSLGACDQRKDKASQDYTTPGITLLVPDKLHTLEECSKQGDMEGRAIALLLRNKCCQHRIGEISTWIQGILGSDS